MKQIIASMLLSVATVGWLGGCNTGGPDAPTPDSGANSELDAEESSNGVAPKGTDGSGTKPPDGSGK